MTDLHTHILPGMDDGAQSVEEAVEMLSLQVQQNVDAVALTPHYYGRRETVDEFLARRNSAYRKLKKAIGERECPKIILSSEVEWLPDTLEWPNLEKLCYEGTNLLLVELPIIAWTDELYQQLYTLETRRGIMPVIAHIDRYFDCQKSRDIGLLVELGYPIQISAEAILNRTTRKKALTLMEISDGLLISDCHNLTDRAPNIAAAMQIVRKKLGKYRAAELTAFTDDILTD